MNISIQEFPSVRVACLRKVGPYGPELGAFWRRPVADWMEANGLMGLARYGIGLDDPAVTPPGDCRYDAAVEIPEDFVVAPPAREWRLPGGTYAVVPFAGQGADIGAAWMALCGQVFQGLLAGHVPDPGRPVFEFYAKTARFDPSSGAFACDLCVPVRPR